MSLLGDKLKYHIEESGLTVYMLSKLSGVNRTSIVRTLSSNRLPERENIEKLLPYLRLTPSEKEEIIQSYEIMSCGENVYYRREYVLKIITTLFSTTVHDTNARLTILATAIIALQTLPLKILRFVFILLCSS